MEQKKDFKRWLRETNSKSIGQYAGAIDTISNELIKHKSISKSIYSLNNGQEINDIIEKYLSIGELAEKNKRGNNMYRAALEKFKEYLENEEKYDLYVAKEDIINEISKIENKFIENTEREVIIKARIGQTEFKNRLLKKYQRCVLCNIDIPELLIASHIKPWTKSNNNEKVDFNNGLLLCPLHDKLFDLGFISFDSNGNIRISNRINNELYKELNINVNINIDIDQNMKKYILWHNDNIFK
jgi:hypothetical protein